MDRIGIGRALLEFGTLQHVAGAKTQRCPSPPSERTPRCDRSATPLRERTQVLQEVTLAIDHNLFGQHCVRPANGRELREPT